MIFATRPPCQIRLPRAQAGLTLIELMVGIAIGLLVDDAELTPDYVTERIGTLMGDTAALDQMTTAAALAGLVNEYRPGASLLPSMNDLRLVSATVAMAVAKTAESQGLARTPLTNPIDDIYQRMWKPEYPRLDVVAADD